MESDEGLSGVEESNSLLVLRAQPVFTSELRME